MTSAKFNRWLSPVRPRNKNKTEQIYADQDKGRHSQWMQSLLLTVFFNTLIALFITAMDYGGSLLENMVFSQCIGLSICCGAKWIFNHFAAVRPLAVSILVMVTIAAAVGVGAVAALMITGGDLRAFFTNSALPYRTLLLGLLFGVVITYFFVSREKFANAEARASKEKIRRLQSEKAAAEAQVRLLQAQIEPHFLFNTLSNVLSLLDSNPQRGKTMLMDFMHYLRISLVGMRAQSVTIGQEMEMIRAYLDVAKVRMGNRLDYSITLPERLAMISLPPMLLQPLVENAVKHGLEPKIDGGRVSIRSIEHDDRIAIVVHDTGLGFSSSTKNGLGIANIQERLQALYGNRARLILKSVSSGGVEAVLELPREHD